MSEFKKIREIKVALQFGVAPIPVGRLALRDQIIYFEYDDAFLQSGLEISPLRMPLEPGVKRINPRPFEGLPGVFSDSLPDGWGRLLMDRYLRTQNILPDEISPLDRLAFVGKTGLGALIYELDHSYDQDHDQIDLNTLAEQTREVLEGESDDVLQELIALNGSSAGARPKALLGVNASKEHIIHGRNDLPEGFEHWLVKFPTATDGKDAGAIEYVYSLMAKDAGIAMSETHLFPAQDGPGYFGIKRFDRTQNNRLHMHTASGILHSDYRTPSLDYEDIIGLTSGLTGDARDVEGMFRLAVFNVLSHNRDDHGKNFSFLMNDLGEWRLSPAYDLTFSSGPNGHQSTMVKGEGQSPSIDHLMRLGGITHLSESRVKEIIDQTQNALSKWYEWATKHGVSKSSIKLIQSRLIQSS